MLKNTPLYESHIANGAKMVDFFGWNMPLNYGSQVEEHKDCRSSAGLFDVSHMTVVDILGAGDRQFLRKLLTNDVDVLKHAGRALYTCMCNEHGGIIDDLIVYQRSPDNYRLVFNAATRDRDLAWLREQVVGFSSGIQERTDIAMLAIQGPDAIRITKKIIKPAHADAISTLAKFECVDVDECFYARTGYTGEDGLEIMMPKEKLIALWQNLVNAGVRPCGLAARDTLRIEAGMLLYGQDMDETTTPLESGLGWTIKWQPEDRNFIGMGALISQKQHGIKRKLVGLTMEKDQGIMRTGHKVIVEGFSDGIVTSGTFSPSLNKSIAIARVPMETETNVLVEIRGKLVVAKVGKFKFLG
ncbi:MAG: glycine cleavage system protein T [Legionellales bacterium RIFCSPHIGHO2_12_FULL_35_11]|nr:MAG: glycine cleavage system protein T [Legionellales bacterium RIFCSPHIGHO2_12_FULL_35_11]